MELLENSENGFDGRFIIYKYDENTIYKKIKKEIHSQKLLLDKIKKNFSKYKNIIENIYKSPFFPSIKGYDVEDDGSYKCKIIHGYRLDRIAKLNLKNNEIIKIRIAILKLKSILNKNVNKLSGDWALHNLIYSINDDKIYNVDLEGFFSYPSVPSWGNINFINKWLDDCIKNIRVNNVVEIVKYVKTTDTSYSGKHIDIGYHSIYIDSIYYRGQRDCVKRLEFCKDVCDFKNKNVLDIGCNIGGMLFPLSSIINYGCGIDFNYKNINSGNALKQYKNIHNLSFYVFNLDTENHNFIKNFMPKIDIVFLYSVCKWIKKWKELISFISKNSKVLFIETNGTSDQQQEQIEYCKLKFKSVKKIYNKSLDDKGQNNRKLFFCKN